MGYLAARRYAIEEETFSRGDVWDTWRHLTLPLALRTLAVARPDALFEPVFRDGLIALLALQDVEPTHISCGGFRTSPEGFVTSYATTQALEVLTAVRQDLEQRVNPAITFDLICHRGSAHHSDPQSLVKIGNHSGVMNSTAGLTVMLFGVIAGVLLTVAAALPEQTISPSFGRILLVIGSLLAGLGVASYLATRLHRTPGQRIAVVSFTLFSALVLPILTFVLYS